jgi:hypothetical protein
MKIRKLVGSNIFVIASFCVIAVLGQPSDEERRAIEQGFGDIYHNPKIPFVLQHAKPGYASSGVDIWRTSNALYIDTTPCSTDLKRIVVFVQLYKESKISDARCSQTSYPQFQVIQE